VLSSPGSSRRRGRWCEIVIAASSQETQFGIAVGKKAGNAVRRNRIKRIIRGYLAKNKRLWPQHVMMVIRIKAPIIDEADLIAELDDMIKSVK
jgi:ribonuclease P protein component